MRKNFLSLLAVSIAIGLPVGYFLFQKKVMSPTVSPQSITVPKTNIAEPSDVPSKPLYQTVTFNNFSLQISFEVPAAWLTETRHARNSVKPTTEIMREFLATNYDGDIKNNLELSADYSDYTWPLLKNMNDKELEALYHRVENGVPTFPDATVAGDNRIWYTDGNLKQIDFYTLYNFHAPQYRENYFRQVFDSRGGTNPDWSNPFEWTDMTIDGRHTTVAITKSEFDDQGNEIATKTNGSRIYFIEAANNRDMLVVYKQGRADSQFEQDFENLLQTIDIRDIEI